MSTPLCTEDYCQGGLECCVELGDGVTRYCKVASQCHNLPYWEIILIPVLLGVAALIIITLIACKLRRRERKRLNAAYFAH